MVECARDGASSFLRPIIEASVVWVGGLLLSCALVFSVGCGPTDAASFGEEVFASPRFSTSNLNTFSCATCHSSKPSSSKDEERILPGHTLHDSAFRRAYWGGSELLLLDAASFCFTSFMRGAGPLDPGQAETRALYEYLVSISPTIDAAPLPLTLVRQVTDVPRGDRGRGERVYQAACEGCHGKVDTGDGRSPESAPILPNVTASYPQLFPESPPALVVIEKVRHGQFFALSGTMPPFSLESLSDEDLGALLSYLEL